MQDVLKVMIAVPTSGTVPIGFTYSMCNLISHNAVHGVPTRRDKPVVLRLDVIQSSCIHSNREKLVAGALEFEQTHLLFLDDDMTFDSTILEVMLGRRQPVLVTNYLLKSATDPQFMAIGLNGQRVATTADSTGLLPVLYSGFGASLFDMEVFRKTPQPWFQPEFDPKENAYTTEDFSFFERVRNAGYEVLLDQDASKLVGHIGKKVWRWDEWKPAPLQQVTGESHEQKVA